QELPAAGEEELRTWFHQGRSGSLPRYLEAFAHTVGVMRDGEACRRVAFEAGVDLAADGVVYAEVRFGPGLHVPFGMRREEVIEAVLDGFAAAAAETGIALHAIVTALRHMADSEDVARAAVRFAGEGVVAFDLAGPEAGYPADDHLAALRIASEAGLGLSIHAGEGDGPESMWRAIARCRAQRIAHGVRIIDDTVLRDGDVVEVGALARRVRDHRIHLEVAPTSNLHTGTFPDATRHPLGALYRAGFNIGINTDNRLMSGVTVSDEYAFAVEHHGFTVADLGAVTEAALHAGFGDWPQRRRLIEGVVRPAYASAAG
ncbi:MAG: adenosine deaminase, partial [Actinobacteria bacterium]